MTSNYFRNIIRFSLLALVQVLIFNRMNFFGFINPMVYILFLYWYPIKENRALFLATGFLLGFTIDVFSDTLALHSAATVTIAYLRPTIMRFVFGVNYEFQNFKLSNSTTAQQITFLALLIIAHHLVFFVLEIFSLANFLLILKKVFATVAASLILCLLLRSLFTEAKE
ncbi:rod shape-determining protein MreD [Costertonia aggregata]|uniref:Rod shape-determining protein MreD n=1 Tax=Costertonia aggregata TaxID=343403 RepID=A0A7H9AQS4_9FLAO|nr:rod shape-determining protein MreD [Costertonia aggregata]QLG45808.1 rod shape-determining protein MreD [Costertonia aggregata]